MPYKTLLVHVDLTAHSEDRARIGAQLALQHEAHLVLAAMTGLSRFALTTLETGESDPVMNSHRALLHERANQALDRAEKVAREVGAMSVERRVIDDEAAGGMSLQARYADLLVVSQDDPEQPVLGTAENFPEYVILNCGRPVLVLPRVGRFDSVGRRVMVAWNGSRESTRAVTATIPLLARAEQVQIAVFNPDADLDIHGQQPGADIALYLSRHGVKAETIIESSPGDIGEALLSLAADQSVDMVVMGAYGHSRFREILLGGVTRKLLGAMTVPVVFAH